MKKSKIKKRILIFLFILLFLFSAYSTTWITLNNTWKKHLPNDISSFDIRKDDLTKRTYYTSPPDDKYYIYTLALPYFSAFPWYCNFSINSSSGIDDNHFTIDENGEKIYTAYAMSGSDFLYNMAARIGYNNKIKKYAFNVQPVSANNKYAVSALFFVDESGELLNRDNLSEKELAIYEDSHYEIEDLIKNLNFIFN